MKGLEVSVITPTHGRKSLLSEMLQSLANQTLKREQFEVIVVVDGDTDGTTEAIARLSVPFPLRWVVQQQSGPAAARNHGARLAAAPVLVFLDDDLIVGTECLEWHLAIHRVHPGSVVVGKLLSSPRDRKPGWSLWEERVLEKHFAAMEAGLRPASGRRLYSGNFSVSRSHFLDAGGFEQKLLRGEDVELGFRLERAGVAFHFEPRASVVHRGVRSFDSWRDSALAYGRADAELTLIRGHQQVLENVLTWYPLQKRPLRLLTGLCIGRDLFRSVVQNVMRRAGGALTAVGAYGPAHYAYSAIYKIQYWEGVSRALGGRTALMNAISKQRAVPPQHGPGAKPQSKSPISVSGKQDSADAAS